VIIGLLVIILLQAVYIFSIEKPDHNSVTNDVPEMTKFVSREKISGKLIYAKPTDKTIIQNDEDSFIGFRENEAFPEAGPVEGLLLKEIPNSYHSDISVISDNVLSVRRQVFNEILESREILSSMNFAISSKGGFQATKIEEDSLFSSLGLETGDIIKTINSRDLNSVSDVISMYRQLNVTESLEMRLERQGQEVFYFYQLVD
jgi:hypothetical protein